jgi:two-component system, OmpR family, osmolarity sensor histidine kinase EnvZ
MNLGIYDRFNNFLETYGPRGLYGRALTILITPVVLLQILVAGVILERYLDNLTKVLAQSLSDEIGLLINIYERSNRSNAALDDIRNLALEKLQMNFNYVRGTDLPSPISISPFSPFDVKLNTYLKLDANRKFIARVDADRAYAVATPLLFLFMILSTAALTAIAVIFMRNQINPILELTRAAQAFGKGREVKAFKPDGATEVRLAGQAFLDMKRRIARHVEQRTTMLAGVSHDLRTILTRFKLELAALGDDKRAKPLREDVNEMQHMLEDYMAFVRGDGGEQAMEMAVPQAVQSVVNSFGREGTGIEVAPLPEIELLLKPNAFRRLMTNIVGNAVRYGKHVKISGETRDERLWIYVDDNGPGIPADKRDDVFRPFVRLDVSRNLDKTGTGLGLAIALDIAQAHGGDIVLEDSPLGGLRVAVKIPI